MGSGRRKSHMALKPQLWIAGTWVVSLTETDFTKRTSFQKKRLSLVRCLLK
jgi:hypothetical protein